MDRERVNVDNFVTEALRRTVHDFYREKKYPTLDSLLVAVNEKGVFTGVQCLMFLLLFLYAKRVFVRSYYY